MCVSVMATCVSDYHVSIRCLWRSEEGVDALGTGVADCCELPHGGRNYVQSSTRVISALN